MARRRVYYFSGKQIAMSISARLILFLTIMVGGIMVVTSYYTLSQREKDMLMAREEQMQAHALTLQVAIEDLYGAGETGKLQDLMKRLNDISQIYSVVIFDAEGRMLALPDPSVAKRLPEPPEVRQVLATGAMVKAMRDVEDRKVLSIFMPVNLGSSQQGVFEISQPLYDITRLRTDMVIVTSLLLAAIFLVVFAVTRYSLSRPIKGLLGGAEALGRGDLAYRVPLPRGKNELTKLAREFNRMADNLTEQKLNVARELEERIEMERDLRHKERLASVGYLAAGVAHEMGTALNVIDARAEQLLSHPDAKPEARQRNLKIIRAQVERIVYIVRQLLQLARPYKLNRGPANLAGMIVSTLQRIEADAAAVEVEFEVDIEDNIWVDVDQELMRQVLLNLCLNGIQAMSVGGRLRIEALGVGAEEDIKGLAVVRISDTGAGIAPEHFAHIFDPFYTTKDVGEGTGLGLSLSRRIIEEHGGRIEAVNNPSGGATITIYLPESEALTADASAAESSSKNRDHLIQNEESRNKENESTLTGS